MTYRVTNKFKRLSILQKGLIIIAIPLLFELFFVFILIHLLDESSENIAAEIASQDKIVGVETMIKEIADGTTSAILYNITRREEFRDRNDLSRAKLRKTHAKLMKLCADNPRELESVERLHTSANGWILQQDRAFTSDPQARLSAFFAMPGFAAAQQLMVMRPEGAARVIIDAEQKVQSLQPKKRQQSIIRLQILILFGLAVHMGITIVLANVFAKYISQRLQNVLNNTLRLGARMPLDPPLRGNDEIADLDHALHETASQILNFEKFKEQLVAVVSHELRTPLTSVQGTLTLIEAGALGSFPEKSKAQIAQAQDSVKHLIDLINSLLLLERLEVGSQVLRHDEIDLSALIQECVENQKKLAEEKNVRVECNFDQLHTAGDWEKLGQAFDILLESGIMRAPPGSTFGIHADFHPQENHLEVQLVGEGTPLNTVRAATFFDRTRDFDDSEIGKGGVLLLALSKAIVTAHGGSLSAISEAPYTFFLIRLPVVRRPAHD